MIGQIDKRLEVDDDDADDEESGADFCDPHHVGAEEEQHRRQQDSQQRVVVRELDHKNRTADGQRHADHEHDADETRHHHVRLRDIEHDE
ncbi:hypothetical protein [Paraburkholderia phymatum]|uniref:hypothetical protein n=1 Tax=Paraburkholderia phymatum TaxID=148447 RepID=UPI003D17B47B